MGRRRRKQSSPVEAVVEFAGTVFLVFLLLAYFARDVLPAIFGLFMMALIVLACVAVIVIAILIIRAAARHKRATPYFSTVTARSCSEAAKPLVYLNPYPEEAAWLKPDPPMLPSLEERLRAIDWYQFEKVVGAIYEVYGCNVKRLGGAKPDGGIDLIAEKNGERTVVQCKQWRNRAVKVREVRELLGTLKDANIESGVLVALSGCTDDARALADKHKITIVDEAELVKLIREADGSIDHRIKQFLEDDTKYCPRCEHPLVLRTAAKGPNPGEQFWGCSEYPRCHYTRPNS